jgi:hypothetical protein
VGKSVAPAQRFWFGLDRTVFHRRNAFRNAFTSTSVFAVQRDGDRWIIRAHTSERFGDGVGIVEVMISDTVVERTTNVIKLARKSARD